MNTQHIDHMFAKGGGKIYQTKNAIAILHFFQSMSENGNDGNETAVALLTQMMEAFRKTREYKSMGDNAYWMYDYNFNQIVQLLKQLKP